MAVAKPPCQFTAVVRDETVTERVEWVTTTPAMSDRTRDSYFLHLHLENDKLTGYWCECRGWMYRRSCRHIDELKVALRENTLAFVIDGWTADGV